MMRDVMQSSGLAIYAEIALVFVVVAFLLAVAGSLTRKREHYEALARLPLDDEPESEPVARSTEPSEV